MRETIVPTADDIRRLLSKEDGFVPPWLQMKKEEAAAKQVEKTIEKATAAANNAVQASRSLMQSVESRVEELTQKMAVRGRRSPQELREALNDLFDMHGFSPAEELMHMITNKGHSHYVSETPLRVRILCELQQYVMPKLKSTEIRGKIDHSHTIVIQRIGSDGSITREPLVIPKARETVPVDVEEIKS